ncbi:hypothetical protein ABPG74_013177 [Tetrahymena malaccensis]
MKKTNIHSEPKEAIQIREESFCCPKERRMSKNVNFQTNLDSVQKKITSPQFQSNDYHGFSSQATKSPLINRQLSIKSFKEDSIVRNQDRINKEQPMSLNRKSSINQQCIEMTNQKNQPQGFSQFVLQAENEKKKQINELFPQNEEIFSYQKQNLLQEMNNTEQGGVEEEKCRFCNKKYIDKEKNLNTEKDVEEDEEEGQEEEKDQDNERGEGEEDAVQQDEEQGIKQTNQQHEKKLKKKSRQNDANELVVVCKCAKKCQAHRKCLLTYSFKNKHKCRVCNVQASFKTKRNFSYKSLKENYRIKYKEVSSIFYLFIFNFLAFLCCVAYNIHYILTSKDSLVIFCFLLITPTFILLYGLCFLISRLSMLCIIEISSEITLEEVTLKNKENDLKTEAVALYNKVNTNLNTLNEECITQQYYDKFDRLIQVDCFNQLQNKIISPKNNQRDFARQPYRKNSSFVSNGNNISNQFIYNQQFLQNGLTKDQITGRKQSDIYLPAKRTLFTEDSEQSPHEQKLIQNQRRLFLNPMLPQKNNNSSPSNNKNISSDNIKPNSILSFKSKRNSQLHSASEKNQTQQADFFQINMFNKDNQYQRKHEIIQEEPEKKLTTISVQQACSANNNDSPLPKNNQANQQCESLKKGEQTSRFGQQHFSSQKGKLENNNQKALNLKVDLKKINQYQKFFKQINDMIVENCSSSSVNTSQTQNKSYPKETNERSTVLLEQPDVYQDQPSKNLEISDENRKSNEETNQNQTKF